MKRNPTVRSVPAKLPIPVSHHDKIFWPHEGYTKLDLIEYYDAIFPKLSRYVRITCCLWSAAPMEWAANVFFPHRFFTKFANSRRIAASSSA